MGYKNIYILLTALTIIYSCEQDPKIALKKLTAKELKAQLKKVESSDSLQYVSVKLFDFQENMVMTRASGFFRSAEYKIDGWNIIGELTNSALLANYKDIVLTVSYFSQTNTLIEKKDLVVYEYIKPNSSVNFTLKVNPPDGTNHIELAVKSMNSMQDKRE